MTLEKDGNCIKPNQQIQHGVTRHHLFFYSLSNVQLDIIVMEEPFSVVQSMLFFIVSTAEF